MRSLTRLVDRLKRKKHRKVEDEYLNWLTFANAGMLHGGNPWLMEHAVKNLPSQDPIVEIGSFCGLSTNVISYFLRRNGKTNPMFTCDRWLFEAENGGSIGNGIPGSAYSDYVKSSFMRNVEFFGGGREAVHDRGLLRRVLRPVAVAQAGG